MTGLYIHYGYGMYWDPTYFLIVIAGIISIIAQIRVSLSFSKYSSVKSSSNLTGAMAAERILHSQGIYDVTIRRVSGKLTDHYNPSNKTLNLSDAVFNSNSVAAVGVAAHECGHAIQHATGYTPLKVRSSLVPVANLGSKLSWLFIILGLIFSFNQTLLYIGIIMFSAAVLFQLVTLPVEFDASSRALKLLESNNILYDREVKQTRKVLGAAALTYVASAATAILQLVRLIVLFGGRNNDN